MNKDLLRRSMENFSHETWIFTFFEDDLINGETCNPHGATLRIRNIRLHCQRNYHYPRQKRQLTNGKIGLKMKLTSCLIKDLGRRRRKLLSRLMSLLRALVLRKPGRLMHTMESWSKFSWLYVLLLKSKDCSKVVLSSSGLESELYGLKFCYNIDHIV